MEKDRGIKITNVGSDKQCSIGVVSNNVAVSFTDHSDELRCSEVAFCSSPLYDFDNCPLMAQTDNCKRCSNYEDGTK